MADERWPGEHERQPHCCHTRSKHPSYSCLEFPDIKLQQYSSPPSVSHHGAEGWAGEHERPPHCCHTRSKHPSYSCLEFPDIKLQQYSSPPSVSHHGAEGWAGEHERPPHCCHTGSKYPSYSRLKFPQATPVIPSPPYVTHLVVHVPLPVPWLHGGWPSPLTRTELQLPGSHRAKGGKGGIFFKRLSSDCNESFHQLTLTCFRVVNGPPPSLALNGLQLQGRHRVKCDEECSW